VAGTPHIELPADGVLSKFLSNFWACPVLLAFRVKAHPAFIEPRYTPPKIIAKDGQLHSSSDCPYREVEN